MSVKFLGLRTTIYKVPDLQEAKRWYSDAFGTKPYFDEPFYVGFNIAGYELGLLEDDMAAAAKAANVLTYWGVEDAAKAVAHFNAMGAETIEEPTNVGGEIVVAAVTDPWGNAIGLIYNPEFKLP
ncbi:VOC family protein [Hoeflea prorocentri]|uniref:VOC family protein n=1 Tax=Hoeflea prorocentri TaxID=1922333 RepID=A0A9X3UI93_9HYPH|nr:VOC family protein [Hoeflea prorocentri]MCY6381159.1 VOC family protein [Hoeflea prorocentri]MDA5398959.1 VOC family protein [Hoeflea prorocentri]